MAPPTTRQAPANPAPAPARRAQSADDEFANYGNFDVADSDAQRADIEDGRQASGMMLGKLAEGATQLRILPPRKDAPHMKTPFRTAWKHYFKLDGADVGFWCPRMEMRQKCGACERAAQLMASKNMSEQELGEKMRVGQKFLANVLVRGKEDVMGVKVWEGSGKQQKTMLGFRDLMNVQFANPVNGTDIVVIRTGQQLQTRYELHLDPNGRSRIADDPETIRDVLSKMHDLDGVVNLPTYEDTVAKSYGRQSVPGTGRGGARPAWGGGNNAQQAPAARPAPSGFGAQRRPAAPPPPSDPLDDLDGDLGGAAPDDGDDLPY